MIRAIVTKGILKPLDPLPLSWQEGDEVLIPEHACEVDAPGSTDRLDRWYQDLQAAAAQIDPEDDRLLQQAIQEIRQQAKDIARREMGLP